MSFVKSCSLELCEDCTPPSPEPKPALCPKPWAPPWCPAAGAQWSVQREPHLASTPSAQRRSLVVPVAAVGGAAEEVLVVVLLVVVEVVQVVVAAAVAEAAHWATEVFLAQVELFLGSLEQPPWSKWGETPC